MKKAIKIISVLLNIILIFTLFGNIVFADDALSSIDTIDADKTTDASSAVGTAAGSIIAIARVIAVGIALIMLVVIAMKYMMAAPGDKAEIKKHAVVYVVGAVVLFAVSGILGILAQFATVITYT